MEWVDPMAATLTDERFDDPEWLFEQKLDGFRFLAFVKEGAATLLTRNQIRHRFPLIEAVLLAQDVTDFIIDGEVIWGDRRMGAPVGHNEPQYAVFDVLRLQGRDVTQLSLMSRKQLLREYFLWVDPMVFVEALPEDGIAAYARACREGWEGVMAKRRDSAYEHKRSRAWLKMKCDVSQEFVVGGFTDPSGARVGFGALLIGYYEGGELVYAGKLGTGFDTKQLRELHQQLLAAELTEPPFTRGSGLPKTGAHWVRPELVVDAAFMEWTAAGKLRHPRFIRMRDDKSPGEVVRER